MHLLETLRERASRFSTNSRSALSSIGYSELLVIGLVMVYTSALTYLTILRYHSLHSSAYDLGIYNQSLYTTTQFGRLFYYTADLPANPSGSIFGVHFLPVLVLLLPFYALMPSVEALLGLQSLALGLASVPLYFLARTITSRKIVGVAFAAAYLTSPMVQGVNWFDFHPEAFIPLGMLTAIYAMQSRRWKLYFGGIVLTLSSLEFAGVLVGVYATTVLIQHRTSIVPLLKSRRILEPAPLGLITLAISLAWIGFSLLVIRAINPINPVVFGGVSTWSVLGATSVLTVPVKAVVDPSRAALALSYEFPQKAVYLGLIFAPILPLLSRSLRFLVATLPWMTVSLLSNFTFYYVLHTQYTAFYIPFVFAGGVFGFKSLMESRLLSARIRKSIVSGMIVGLILVSILASPLTTFPLGGIAPVITYGIPEIGEHEMLVSNLISLIPPSASVLTQPNLFPLVSSREDAYLLPYQTYFPPGESFNETFARFLENSEFVLLDTKTDPILTSWILNLLRDRPDYGVYAYADGALLLRKSFHDPPILFSPIQKVWGAKTLILTSGKIIRDSESLQGEVILHSTSDADNEEFWKGPNVLLPPGSYRLGFRMKIGSSTQDTLLKLQIIASQVQVKVAQAWGPDGGHNLQISSSLGAPVTIVETRLYGGTFATLGEYEDIAISFSSCNNSYFEFVGTDASNAGDVYLDQIALLQTSALC